ncbi:MULTISPECIES: acyl-CoA dehydrogenase family protein [Rhodococcus]|jgi:butyryl-CoA dehydrogenase|uniref:acyl-CoA dehydrogenase family protein n=1 Tax=Rhodococcus TaxID=1827 RepID=UPI000EA9CC37|nr:MULTISPECIES: acyl-CoA dehydrogenase family protein [Rhodococcus]NHU41775.1 acyl-CoA dehydrogenase [Rhodococcus sp. A14]MDI9940487.1 acyl-CoA dehydrogenase family protein [Rhodococcus sp. IEGM 1351]QZS57012.1 acyl-CoA dehydrogenase family protein [Rhodococcus opacus]RKM76365.1 butyryl-CoA dehydrogenase [Rhodococcus opacus]UZG53006.1 acyl-CoA dehydrogenase family protein [Rhodococcus opacus]
MDTAAALLTDEQQDLRAMVRKLATERYAPHARRWDRERAFFPNDERRYLGDLGLLGITLPEEYGGGGRPLMDALVVLEELAKASPLAAWPTFEASAGPARVIHMFGTEEQKARLLPPVAAGDVTIAVSISEPGAGSAATDVTTRAVVDGDEIVIDGAKRWCSGAGHAEQYLVYVRLGPEAGGKGVGAVIVDKDTPGLTFGPQEELMGHRGVGSADMFFDGVRVPVENLIIEKGGFNKLFTAFSIERLGNATHSLAIGQACLDRTAAYVQERQQFGKDIAEFQMVQGSFADMVIEVEAARLLIHRAATNAGCGFPAPLEASVAKCFANEMAKKVSDLAIQLHGGYGYSAEYDVERLHRDAHGWALAGGTTNIQRMRIASEYLGRRFDQRA